MVNREIVARKGFTLIEVLVVVAIIALLISILLPSLRLAKERSRLAVCLSNLKQQGIGFSAYSNDNKSRLPMTGAFRYTLAEGAYYPFEHGGSDWVKVNGGQLYPKYVGSAVKIFFCPSNRDADGTDERRGIDAFVNRVRHPRPGDPQYVDSHDHGNSPIGAYGYALPAASGKAPLNAGADMYPVEVMEGGPFYDYMMDTEELSPQEAAAFLGPFPQPFRGKHNVHALLTDAYFGGYRGYHIDGFNVLYGDMHARHVPDPRRRIIDGVGGGSRYNGSLASGGRAFMVWDYFSQRP